MRKRAWKSYRQTDKSPEVQVVVVEDEGELIGLIMDPSRPAVRVRLGQTEPSPFLHSCNRG
jgi:hypothetical protein